jgi:hypothetical protein
MFRGCGSSWSQNIMDKRKRHGDIEGGLSLYRPV